MVHPDPSHDIMMSSVMGCGQAQILQDSYITAWIMRRLLFISIFDSEMGLYAFLSQMTSWGVVRMKWDIRPINYSAPPSCWEAVQSQSRISDKVQLCSTPPLQQHMSKDEVSSACQHWNLLAHHPRGQWSQHIHLAFRNCRELPLAFRTVKQKEAGKKVKHLASNWASKKSRKSQKRQYPLLLNLLEGSKYDSSV